MLVFLISNKKILLKLKKYDIIITELKKVEVIKWQDLMNKEQLTI